jgi:hypothetical protein
MRQNKGTVAHFLEEMVVFVKMVGNTCTTNPFKDNSQNRI